MLPVLKPAALPKIERILKASLLSHLTINVGTNPLPKPLP